jgi:hypothetical protein
MPRIMRTQLRRHAGRQTIVVSINRVKWLLPLRILSHNIIAMPRGISAQSAVCVVLFCGVLFLQTAPTADGRGLQIGNKTGIALLAAGLSIATNVRARLMAILLGILFLLYALLLEVSLVAVRPMSVSVRTVFFETLGMCASALTLASWRFASMIRTLRTSGPARLLRWECAVAAGFAPGMLSRALRRRFPPNHLFRNEQVTELANVCIPPDDVEM